MATESARRRSPIPVADLTGGEPVVKTESEGGRPAKRPRVATDGPVTRDKQQKPSSLVRVLLGNSPLRLNKRTASGVREWAAEVERMYRITIGCIDLPEEHNVRVTAWAVGGIEFARLKLRLCESACTWEEAKTEAYNYVPDPEVGRWRATTLMFNSKFKNGQTVDSFMQYMEGLEEEAYDPKVGYLPEYWRKQLFLAKLPAEIRERMLVNLQYDNSQTTTSALLERARQLQTSLRMTQSDELEDHENDQAQGGDASPLSGAEGHSETGRQSSEKRLPSVE